MDVYAPARYYSPGFYSWAYKPWTAPVTYSWGWSGAPWYGYFGNYFNPYPVYPSASFWLTDYLIAHNLQAAYTTQASAQSGDATAAGNGSPLTPDVKQKIAEEVQGQIALENAEADANARDRQSGPASGSITPLFSDDRPHIFIAANDLDVVDITGRECVLSHGDVVAVMSAPSPTATGATAVVLASKGGKDCPKSANITIAFNDLQDMQNHMRETIDLGMAELQSKQGNGEVFRRTPRSTSSPRLRQPLQRQRRRQILLLLPRLASRPRPPIRPNRTWALRPRPPWALRPPLRPPSPWDRPSPR